MLSLRSLPRVGDPPSGHGFFLGVWFLRCTPIFRFYYLNFPPSSIFLRFLRSAYMFSFRNLSTFFFSIHICIRWQGGLSLFGAQIVGIVVVLVWSFILVYCLFRIFRIFQPLRVEVAEEDAGSLLFLLHLFSFHMYSLGLDASGLWFWMSTLFTLSSSAFSCIMFVPGLDIVVLKDGVVSRDGINRPTQQAVETLGLNEPPLSRFPFVGRRSSHSLSTFGSFSGGKQYLPPRVPELPRTDNRHDDRFVMQDHSIRSDSSHIQRTPELATRCVSSLVSFSQWIDYVHVRRSAISSHRFCLSLPAPSLFFNGGNDERFVLSEHYFPLSY